MSPRIVAGKLRKDRHWGKYKTEYYLRKKEKAEREGRCMRCGRKFEDVPGNHTLRHCRPCANRIADLQRIRSQLNVTMVKHKLSSKDADNGDGHNKEITVQDGQDSGVPAGDDILKTDNSESS